MGKKQSTWLWVLVAIFAVLLLSGSISLQGFDFSKFNPFAGEVQSGLCNVNKQVKYTLVNYYAGSAIASSSNTISVYDSDGETILESNLDTDAAGQGNTAFSYNSGKKIYFKYVSTNDKIWWEITVPQMNVQDAEAATYNLIELRAFAIGTYTDALTAANGTSLADSAVYSAHGEGESPVFTYTLRDTGNDNTGLLNSYDPLYKHNWHPVLYVLFSGTGYERILPYGFTHDFTLGTTHYVAIDLDPYSLTKHKVGNEYRSTGVKENLFNLDCSAMVSGDSVTMQVYLKCYSDPAYCMSHGGNYGTSAYEAAETTLTIQHV